MRICELMASYEEGGLENHFIDLCNGLADQGHDVHAIVDPRFSQRFSAAVQVHPCDFGRMRLNPLLLWQLRQRLRQINADVVHAHAGKATSLLASLKRWQSAPCVATLHNMKKRKHAYNRMDAVIGVSRGVMQGINGPRSYVIYNGITVDQQDSRSLASVLPKPWSTHRPTLLAVGRLVPVKGFDRLIRAFASANLDANLVIIGEGPLRAQLMDLITRLNLDDRIQLAGFVENAGALVRQADLLVISSSREGFNYVMAEALCSAVPVVSTDVPAPNEILPADYLCPMDDVALGQVLASTLARLPERRQTLQPVFQWARQNLSKTAMIEHTAQCLTEVAGQ